MSGCLRFACCEPQRLEVLKTFGSANAIDYLEVRDHEETDIALRQRTLYLHLIRPGFALTADQVRIDGGERIPVVGIDWVAVANALPPGEDPALVAGIDDLAKTLVIRTTVAGDFSRYTLHLLANSGSPLPPPGFDPKLSCIAFSFKVECPSDYDCAATASCPPAAADRPVIDYLAKDYEGFRRLMLDRLSLLAPGWSERSAADAGIAIVELLAYAADNLSYRQDAIANEAYLSTARRRVSVRRHTRLVDYHLHDGCNARVWVQAQVSVDTALAAHTQLLTGLAVTPELAPASRALSEALAGGALVFETVRNEALFAAHNRLPIYTWGDVGCCLPRGATRATLRGAFPNLAAGAVLIFEEVRSPTTFRPEDADRAKRCAVRLTSATVGADPSGQLFDDPAVDAPLAITEIEWEAADALPFPVCVSVASLPGEAISVALGNILLADHGRTLDDESLGAVPEPRLKRVPASVSADCGCDEPEVLPVPPRFRPRLKSSPVTQGYALADELALPVSDLETWWPASRLLLRDPHEALPQIARLFSDDQGLVTGPWTPRHDLLASAAEAADFVVETDNDGSAHLRFGDDHHGRRPNAGTLFTAGYRVGNGTAGNVGADTIGRIVSLSSGVFLRLRNPLPAAGGIDPESLEAARRDAPQAFRTQKRAVTAADYAAAAERRPEVQRAAASFRWTGSWQTVFVSADRYGGGAVDAPFENRLRRQLEPVRMAGYDLEVGGPRLIALDIALHVCVKPDYFRSEVLRAVRAVLGSGVLPDGRLGLFHPDNFSFGQPVFLSAIIAAAQAVTGVEAVSATRFRRLAAPDAASLANGVITIGRLEIAQLANDPNFRERGRLELIAGGGK